MREVWRCLRKQNGTIAQDVKKKRFGIIMRPGVDLVTGNVGIAAKKKLFEPITFQIGNIKQVVLKNKISEFIVSIWKILNSPYREQLHFFYQLRGC